MAPPTHKGSIGSLVEVSEALRFLSRSQRKVDKSRWCGRCKTGGHFQCLGRRLCVDRIKRDCECPCRLDELDPNL